MQTSPSPTEHDSATQFDRESYSLLKAFVVALILFVLSQYSLRWLPPVTLWLLWRLYREGGFREGRRIAMALWQVAIPTAVFLGYHTLKWRLTGHFLVSPEFQDANLGRVSGPLTYLERMWHSVN